MRLVVAGRNVFRLLHFGGVSKRRSFATQRPVVFGRCGYNARHLPTRGFSTLPGNSTMIRYAASFVLLFVVTFATHAQDATSDPDAKEPGAKGDFVSLFDGETLEGWPSN